MDNKDIIRYRNPEIPNIIYPEYIHLEGSIYGNYPIDGLFNWTTRGFRQSLLIKQNPNSIAGKFTKIFYSELFSGIRVFRELPLLTEGGILTDYIYADYYFPDFNLILEIDDCSHFKGNGTIVDSARDSLVSKLGLKLVRIPTMHIKSDSEILDLSLKFKSEFLSVKETPIEIDFVNILDRDIFWDINNVRIDYINQIRYIDKYYNNKLSERIKLGDFTEITLTINRRLVSYLLGKIPEESDRYIERLIGRCKTLLNVNINIVLDIESKELKDKLTLAAKLRKLDLYYNLDISRKIMVNEPYHVIIPNEDKFINDIRLMKNLINLSKYNITYSRDIK